MATRNPKYPSGKAKAMKKDSAGNPFPYEMEHVAEGGVSDGEVVEKMRGELKYTPKPQNCIGDDGLGGHK
jgi:hypothetical protein